MRYFTSILLFLSLFIPVFSWMPGCDFNQDDNLTFKIVSVKTNYSHYYDLMSFIKNSDDICVLSVELSDLEQLRPFFPQSYEPSTSSTLSSVQVLEQIYNNDQVLNTKLSLVIRNRSCDEKIQQYENDKNAEEVYQPSLFWISVAIMFTGMLFLISPHLLLGLLGFYVYLSVYYLMMYDWDTIEI
jgi:hypothetical protein